MTGTGPDTHELAGIVLALEPELVALRRDLHAHPEPSWQEFRTTEVIRARLAAAGLSPEVAKIGTGVMCDVGTGGPMVAIRADIDALRLTDTKDAPYRSTVEGVCHACGHDLHAAATLGAGLALAQVLAAHDGAGRVRLIFQPAEEAIPSGASALVAEGVMDGVDAAFSLHVDPSHPVGTVAVSAGPITSTADQLEIRLKGPGGHTGRPHQTADLAHIAGRIVVDLPAALSRLTDPRDGVNLTFGSIQVGDAANVVATDARLLASLRTTGRGAWDLAPGLLRRVLAGIVEPLGATWELDHNRGAPPIVNDPWAVSVIERVAGHVLGPDRVGPTVQSGGGEDFSWYGEHAPVGYLRLGVATPGAPLVDIHAGSFDLDERAIALGARVLAGTALEALADLRARIA
ncbi:MAG: N-acyl-L-amino acid amidohydrolase [Acidimicrobiales bacterium]|nr:N-acyl-L-amino acid amidohydrolase [Acidimicrobiales bacterium]